MQLGTVLCFVMMISSESICVDELQFVTRVLLPNISLYSFDLHLGSFGVDLDSLKREIKRTFHAWIEPWEKDCIFTNDPVSERALLEKYKNMSFFDEENGVMLTCHEGNLQWNRKKRGSDDYTVWHLIMVGEDGSEDAWEINDKICGYMAITNQSNIEGLEIIHGAGANAATAPEGEDMVEAQL